MSYAFKSILLTLMPGAPAQPSPTAATRFAIALAKRDGAFLQADYLAPKAAWAPYSLWTNLPHQMLAGESRRLDEEGHAVLASVRTAMADANVEGDAEFICLDYLALLGRAVIRAQLQDLIVLDAQPAEAHDALSIMRSLVFRTGRPVIRIPAAAEPPALPRRIVVGWDGSVPAIRAIREGLPLLTAASHVEIVSVQGEKDLSNVAPGGKLVRYLRHHGVDAISSVVTAQRRDAGAALAGHASESKADMLVLGAYAHSRVYEAVLGGVTRSFLESGEWPILMAH